MATTRAKAERLLVTHRDVARMIGIDTETLRYWVAEGEFPEPHSIVKTTWFYRAATIDHYVATARWPEGTRFRATGGKGRQAPNPSPSTNGAAVS